MYIPGTVRIQPQLAGRREEGYELKKEGSGREQDGGGQRQPLPPVAPLPPPDVPDVGEQGEQVEDAAGQVGPPDDARHRLGVDRVGRKQQPGDGHARPARRQEVAGQLHHQPGCERVQQHVDQVVAERFEPVQQVVELEAGDAQRPVGAVRARVHERCAPEVVVQHLRPAARTEHVRIAKDRSSATKKEKRIHPAAATVTQILNTWTTILQRSSGSLTRNIHDAMKSTLSVRNICTTACAAVLLLGKQSGQETSEPDAPEDTETGRSS
uniref:Uncharacterized protein n=1 Tax=Anopheles coluzzii TaxID=1518534 RepID=A0A8W7P9H0_ANOCL